MKNIYINNLIRSTLLCLFALQQLVAQNAAEDFEKINTAGSSIPKVSMNIIYSVFSNHSTGVFIDRQYGVYKKDKNNYYNSLMGLETIVSDSKMITVHKGRRAVLLSPAKPLLTMNLTGKTPDALLKNYKRTQFIKKNDKEYGYIVALDGDRNELSRFEIYFDPQTYLITKLVLYYARAMDFSQEGKGKQEKPRLEIEFTNINTAPDFNADDFNLKKYVVFGNKNILAAPYQGYTLVESKF